MNWVSFDLDQKSLYESRFAGNFNLLQKFSFETNLETDVTMFGIYVSSYVYSECILLS